MATLTADPSAETNNPDAAPEAVVVRFAGDSGDGMQLTGGQFTLSTALAGNDLATFPDFPAEIRAPQGTLFGVSAFQINFGSMFVSKSVNEGFSKRRKHVLKNIEKRGLTGEEKEAYIDKYVEQHPIGDADISDVVANIDHVVKLVGIDYVGLGSDFDGIGDNLPTGLKDVSCYPNLIYELLKKGYAEEDIEKICSGNFLRVWSKVLSVAADLRREK